MAKPKHLNSDAGTALNLSSDDVTSVRAYVKSGSPWVWMTAAAIAASAVIVVCLMVLLMVRGLPHFWPADVVVAKYEQPNEASVPVMAEIRETEEVLSSRLKSAGLPVSEDKFFYDRSLIKVGNRDILGSDFRYVIDEWLVDRRYPENAAVFERLEWGNFHGYLRAVTVGGKRVEDPDTLWQSYDKAQRIATDLRERIHHIEYSEIGAVNYALEKLRLQDKALQLNAENGSVDAEKAAEIQSKREQLNARYNELSSELDALYREINKDSVEAETVTGQKISIPMAKLVRAYLPNDMSFVAKLGFMLTKIYEFVSEPPREANTEGGIAPAIFGTVMMTLIMSVFVMPFGVVAALYLREYARQGVITRSIRIAVNNLAGVPSIVFGMFGLGFFVYFVGGTIDDLFYPEAAPQPVFGTGGILWASLTLALLTLPVVIVATEEGLARIPRSLREASLALGATKAETLWRVVLPMASPAIMTGLILAIARAAGEVAPLMLVGVVKLAPSLPLDGNIPFIHLERKFMHLGFHIYDVGFQSPNVEAARPLVYATSLLLVFVVMTLNLSAVFIRNRLRERYKSLEH